MPRRRNAVSLTEDRLLAAALAIVDEGGMPALSMRRLGTRLGVDPMAVYYHVPNKDALVKRLVAHVFGQLRPVIASGSWQDQVLDWAAAYRELALAHPNLILQIVMNQEAVDVAAPLANEALHAALRRSGLDGKAVEQAADTLVDYVNGYVLSEAGGGPGLLAGSAGFRFGTGLFIRGVEASARGS